MVQARLLAKVTELADDTGSNPVARKGVRVRLPPFAFRRFTVCRDCKDTGEIVLLTSTKVCDCVLPDTVCSEGAVLACGGFEYRGVKGRAVRIDTDNAKPAEPDPVCFGTINGVTLHGDPALHRDRAPTYTLEVEDSFGRRTQFTGLEKHQVDAVHAMLKAGWTAEGVRDHLNELWTAARVRQSEKDRQAADLEAAGFTVDEIKAVATKIEERLFSVSDDGEAEQIIFDEIAGLICRKIIRRTLECLIPNIQKMPKGGIVSGEKFRQQCGLSFVPESPYHGMAEFIMPRKKDCPKAEMYRRMYGGKPNPDIDCSQIELRMLAHLQKEPPLGRPDPEFPGPSSPPPDAG